MPTLSAIDWLLVLIYFFFVITIALSLRQFIASSTDFLLAGRVLPAWLCGFAFVAASLGSLEVLGMGAAGARYGMASASFFGLGSIIPLLFAALFLVPVYYGSKARSLPGYLGLRFDGKTRVLGALAYLKTSILYAALLLYLMARVTAALGLFNVLFHAQRVGDLGVLILSIALPAALVLVYVLLGGLGATMYAQVMQFFLLVAAFLPVVLLGLKQVGGWSGMRSKFAAATAHTAAGTPANGLGALALAALAGIVLTAGYWCTDFSLLQAAMAAEDSAAARRAPLIAAAARVLLPFLLVVPGIIAIGLPTPHTMMVVHSEGGAIYHDITVVPRAAEQGQGLIPARTDSITDPTAGNILRDAHGHTLLNYAMATPNLLPYNLPTGLLGLAIAALLACVTGGVAARISAVSTVFTTDLYQPYLRKDASDKHYIAVARWTAVVAVLLSVGLACAALLIHNMPGILDLLALAFALLSAPVLMTFLLGIFWKRITGHGAFAGILAGYAAALAHYVLTLPAEETRGVAGGWIAALHHPPSALVQNLGTALCAIVANCLVTIAVSLFTTARTETDLAALVYAPETVSAGKPAHGVRPVAFAAIVLLASIAVSLIFLF